MSQTRLRNYKHDILSFEHNIFNLGMHNAGRYCGFDTVAILTPLTFNITHAATGISFKNPVNVVTGPIGLILTPQGDLVMEDDLIGPFSIDTNLGNTEIRYDLLVFSHDHIVAVGGVNGTYSIIRGDFASPVKPILVDPLKQVAVGVIELPPNASHLADCIYRRIKCPDSGDGEDARLLEPNVFKAIQFQKRSGASYAAPSDSTVLSGVTANLYTLQNDGNVFEITTPLVSGLNTFDGIRIKDITLQDGARIYLNINQNMVLRQTSFFMPTYGSKGYRPFKMNVGMANITFPGGDNGIGINPDLGEIWEVECVLRNDAWNVMKLGGCGTNSVFRRGMTMLWYGDLSINFNNDGAGINLMKGWQVCNGLHGALDLRGKLMGMGTTGVPSIGAADLALLDPLDYIFWNAYDTLGKRSQAILQANIPNYTLVSNAHDHRLFSSGAHGGNLSFDPFASVAWSSEDANGNNDYQAQYATGNPNPVWGRSSSTNVTTPSGGSGTPFEFLPPTYMHVFIQKV